MNSALQSGSLPHRSPATGHAPLTPVFATLTKTTGVYTNSSQNGTRRLRRKGTAMNDRTTSIVTASIQLHCQHRFPSQRFCRLPIADPESGLCSKHAAEHQKDLDQADLAASLIGDAEEFRSAVVINRSLGELYKLQARNKINPRRAAVMAYTCNLLLRTLPAIEHELHPELEDQPQIII